MKSSRSKFPYNEMASNLSSQNAFSNGGCFRQSFGLGAFSLSAAANGKNTRIDVIPKSTEDFSPEKGAYYLSRNDPTLCMISIASDKI